MKQKFIAVFVALAFVGFGWAAPKHTVAAPAPAEEEEVAEDEDATAVEDTEEEVEEDTEDADEEEVVAPAPKKVKNAKKKAAEDPAYFLGFGTDLLGENFGYWRATLNVTADVSIYILLNYTTSSTTTEIAGVSNTTDASSYGVGAGVSYGFATPILPTYAGLALVYNGHSTDDDYIGLDFQIFGGIKASPVKGFEIAAQPGFDIKYASYTPDAGVTTISNTTFSLATRVYLTWFIF